MENLWENDKFQIFLDDSTELFCVSLIDEDRVLRTFHSLESAIEYADANT